MPVLQLIGGSVIFLQRLAAGSRLVAPLLALYLAWLILVAGSLAFTRPLLRWPLLAAKTAACLTLGLAWEPALPTALFLLPSLGLEAASLLASAGRQATGSRASPAGPAGPPPRRQGWAVAWALVLAAPAAWLPRGWVPGSLLPAFLGAWAVTVYVAVMANRQRLARSDAAERRRALERAVAVAESRQASQARASSGQETLTRLEERERLAQNLHDQLGHTITGSIMQLEAAGLLLTDDPTRATLIIDRASDTLREGLAAIRLSLKAIKPECSTLGRQRLQAQLDDFSARHGLATELVLEGDAAAVTAAVWQAAEENLREALTNLLRHSSASRFSCRISVLNRVCKIEFRDDGQLSGPLPVPGMGLEGIEARTRHAGGNLIVDTSRGFSLIMLFAKGGPEDGHTHSDRG
ncbi:MAG: hypothetical protein A2087_02000 [Spirochaetes bacterium GWD1_61_31]|nr:MAG: hypothetical protein A2Y37_11730 [Spirochaetes bacterium GWB1_60_80]OHD29937.1 MAG: hypothetical protein A2004_11970 [Spirochaetes bacterium GWC1_61_12]OHD43794.1 MAG: hypothetical protein A2087_02000 [Spirochaetes bacterium GWD1_61_31]OHD46036.1 MAG: hypothetical protein A2Y35_13555 [Spirochaetes bacterium GWE1_60_18]OHD60608.1 MAG: hypothetical protein A2Y32_08045 [Spirochaetes bacterium GWF1_60_12]HAP43447.1 hypothetical protein [Spirochaetaceae bacterium]